MSLPTPELNVPASGGKGTVAVSTNRECAWTANSTASWLTISGAASGQGDGTVEYVATANSDPASRRGVIELNDQRANITQAAADCAMQLADPSESFTPAGGSGTIGVRASSGMCTWTAVSDSSWITIRSGASGTGNGTVAYDVAAATGAPRTGTVLVAGLRFSITQSQSCTYSVAPTSYSPAPGGGSTIVNVSTAVGCPWTAASNVPWATVVQGATGTGPGAAQVVVDGTSGPTRTGSVLVAGQLVTITQGAGCSFSADPLSHSFGAQGGTGTATITAAAGCAWTAASDSPWITLMGSTSGTGGGGISFAVSPVSGPARGGTITVAGIQVTVSQSAGCTVTLGSAGQQLEAAGGDVSVSVTAAAGCAWTAASNVSWITVASGGSGTGDGTVKLTVAPTSAARSGTVTIAGQTFTVNQQGSGSACTFSIDPKSANVPASGGTGSVQLVTSAGCTWTATSNAPWLTITSGGSGSGPGNVGFSAAAMTGGPRSGTLTVGGQTFTVNQGNGCAFSISPTSTNIAASGGNSSFEVAAGAGCAWTATSSDAWLTITSGATGSGGGTVQFAAASTNGGSRSATITVADQTFTVNQGGGCSFSIAPTSTSVAAGGGNGPVAVTAGNGCDWTATSNASWLSVTSGANGSGNGTVRFTAASTNGGSRSGTITIAGQTFTVNQGSGCSFSLAQSSANAAAGGGTGSVGVTAGGGCSWTAASNVPWLTITASGSGSGNGTVQYSVASNTGGARSGTLTIGGQTFTVNQASGCSFSLSQSSANAAAGGGTGSVAVTAGGGCSWTAASNASWLTVTSGASGSGNGTVQYSAAANTGGARSGTLTIAGQTFTVNQASGCSISISATSANVSEDGVKNASVAVTAAGGCAWTAVSNVPWIDITSGASDSGNGNVRYSVDATTGPARSGTMTIGGHTFTVNQASGCTYQVTPATFNNVPALSATRSVTVTTAAGCTWTTTPHVSWITVTNGASGNGNGTVTLTIAANLIGSRSGTVTVAGQTVTVNQLGVVGLDPAPELAARTQERSEDSGYPDSVQETEHGSAGRQGEERR